MTCLDCPTPIRPMRAKSGRCKPCYGKWWRANRPLTHARAVRHCRCGNRLSDPRNARCQDCLQRGDLPAHAIDAIIAAELRRIRWRRQRDV